MWSVPRQATRRGTGWPPLGTATTAAIMRGSEGRCAQTSMQPTLIAHRCARFVGARPEASEFLRATVEQAYVGDAVQHGEQAVAAAGPLHDGCRRRPSHQPCSERICCCTSGLLLFISIEICIFRRC